MQVIFSTTLSCLLPIAVRIRRFQYIDLYYNWLRSKTATECAAFINMSLNVQPW